MITVHIQSPKENRMTPIMKARPPKAYSFKANIPVGEMLRFSISEVLLPLKATDVIGEEYCGLLMNIMRKRQALDVII